MLTSKSYFENRKAKGKFWHSPIYTALSLLQYAIAYSISRRFFWSLFPIRTILCSYIQLALDRAKNYYSLCSVTLKLRPLGRWINFARDKLSCQDISLCYNELSVFNLTTLIKVTCLLSKYLLTAHMRNQLSQCWQSERIPFSILNLFIRITLALPVTFMINNALLKSSDGIAESHTL